MKKVILVTYEEYPSFIGLSTRVKGLYDALLKKGFRVEIVAPLYKKGSRPLKNVEGAGVVHYIEMPDVLRVVKIPIVRRVAFVWTFTSLLKKFFREYADDAPYIIQAEQAYTFWGSAFGARRFKAKLIFDDPTILERLVDAKLKSIPPVCGLVKKMTRAVERGICRQSDYIICSADRVMDYYQGIAVETTQKIKCLCNGVNLEDFPSLRNGERNKIFFNCSLPYFQNMAALKNLVKIIACLDQHDCPYSMTMIFNSLERLPEDIKKVLFENKRIQVLERVPNLSHYLNEAEIVLLPYETGHFSTGGSRLKTLEAMASARMVFSTPEGMDGVLGGTDGVHYVMCRDWQDMAVKLEAHLRDAEDGGKKAAEMGRNARQLIAQKYSWDSLAELYRQL